MRPRLFPGAVGTTRELIEMHKTSVAGLLPVLALLITFAGSPALAGYESVDEGTSLSGSYLAGRYAGKLRDTDIAEHYFEQALRDDPNNSVLIERVFVFALSEGNINAAEEYATRVLSFNSEHRMARIVLGCAACPHQRDQHAAGAVDAPP